MAKSKVSKSDLSSAVAENSADGKKTAAPATGNTSVVKAIKNNLFKEIPIGGHAKIAGCIKATEMDEGTYGTFTRFIGDFRAKAGGMVFIAGKLYVPAVAEPLLQQGYDAGVEAHYKANPTQQPGDDDPEELLAAKRKMFLKTFKGVEFGFTLEKVADTDPKNARGFQWVAKPMLEIAPPSDKFLALVSGE